MLLACALAAALMAIAVRDPVRWYQRRRLEQTARMIQDACLLARANAVARSCEVELTVLTLSHDKWSVIIRYPRGADTLAQAAANVAVIQQLPRGVTCDRVCTMLVSHEGRSTPSVQMIQLTAVHGRRYWRRSLRLPFARTHFPQEIEEGIRAER